VLRWPGGLFADGYHWKDGVGPDRPVRPNVYWRRFGPLLGPRDPNRFGTHEFLALCKTLGAKPYVNVNLGTGTPREAAEWVRYCNDPADSVFGARRAANGREKPWDVNIWGIGNESFGFWALGHSGPAAYAKRYLEFHEAMTDADPSIAPVAVGTCDIWPQWNPIVLSRIGDAASYLSVHVYLPGNLPQYLFMRIPGTPANHYALSAAFLELSRKIRFAAAQIREVLGERSATRLALDEWNLWWWWPQAYKVWWKMRDAVALAGMAGALADNCEAVGMANLAQAVNVLGLLQTDGTRVVKTPSYHVMRMFASALTGRRLHAAVDAPTYSSKKLGGIPSQPQVPYLSAHAAIDGRRVGLVLVQRRYDGPVTVEIDAHGVAFDRVEILSAPSPESKNTFAEPDLVRVHETFIKNGQGGAALELPAASVAAVWGTYKP